MPWAVIGICYLICPGLLLIIRYVLARENKRRDAEPPDNTYDDVYMEIVMPDGKRVERKVDKVRPTPRLSGAVASASPTAGVLTCAIVVSRNSWI